MSTADVQTRMLTADGEDLAHAAHLLRQGKLVAFPTETVYGLGGNAQMGQTVAGIYEAKGRPSFNPLIVHVPDAQSAWAYGVPNPDAHKLATAFWPGALTLVLPLQPGAGLSALVTAGLPSVALRVPASPLARHLLHEAQCPVAAPSANPSGRISPTTAAHVAAGLNGKIAAIVDGGPCEVGLESTIVDLTDDSPMLLRAGGLAVDRIEAVLNRPLQARNAPETASRITAPGQLASHYAPGARVRLNAQTWQPRELRLGFGPVSCDLNLSERGDLTEAAANLFGHLHRLDAMNGAVIAVSPIPQTGLGLAINDRLSRAAAPR